MQRGTELIASRFNSAFFNHQNHSFFWCPGCNAGRPSDGVSLLGAKTDRFTLYINEKFTLQKQRRIHLLHHACANEIHPVEFPDEPLTH